MKQKHLLFASYEIHPITAGGCGVFIWHAINELLKTTDYKITLLLDISKFECEEFIQKYKTKLPNNERLNVVCLSDRIPWEYLPMESFNNIFLFKSYMFYRVIESIVQEEQVDYVEFFDYVGIGYFSVNAKKYEGKFPNTILGVRGHCTVDLMDLEQCQVDFCKEKIEMYQMEKIALQNADVVLVQTEAWKELYATRYGVEIGNIVVSEPPMDNSDFPKYEPHKNKNVLFYGRVFQLKGIDDYIQAGIQYLTKHKGTSTKFYIVGYDGKTKEGTSYTSYLKESIPKQFKENFIFTGKLSRSEFKTVLNDISVAVFPNYVESFCYSIHELYEVGVPIIYRDIPAFSSYFSNKENCRMFSNSISEITNHIEQVLLEVKEERVLPKSVLTKSLSDSYTRIMNDDKFTSELDIEEDEIWQEISIILVGSQDRQASWMDKYSPIVLYINEQENLIPIQVMGRKFWIEEQKLCEKLKQNIIIIDNNIEIKETAILSGAKILKQTDLTFIDFLELKDSTIRHKKSDIYLDCNLEEYSYIAPIIFKNTKDYISEVFDFRYGSKGFLEKLQDKGYTFLETYEIKEKNSVKVSLSGKEEDILYNHRKTIGKEWDPLILSKLYFTNEDKAQTVTEKMTYGKKRIIYLKVKEYLYKNDSKLGYFLLNLLENFKNIYKKIFRFFVSS